MVPISFFFENISSPFSPGQLKMLPGYLSEIISKENFTLDSLTYIFCNDKYLYEMNIKYLDHDYYTDVITFDNSESPQVIDGDIFISIDRIADNAQTLKLPFFNELYRVMIHGLLHLLGYDDKTIALSQIMRDKENFYLINFKL